MFIRTCKARNKTGKTYLSHQLVETVQTDKGPRTRIIFSLGRLDLTPERIKLLEALFRVGAPVVNPAGGRPDLAVLFFPAVLPDDELRRRGTTRDSPGTTRAGVTAM